ncbi:membrane-associated transporter protein-like [Dysidea avara]|uniref:membrane-associated transporter protein-like n=1 Tax=Dysidea avara TaxID=196820 RepID=UPI00332A17DE
MVNVILWLRVIALNSVWGIIGLLYALEGAYFVPAIYDKGFSPIYGSMLLCLSPVLGILFQSYLGSASDRCNCRFGKRRPFILALTICCILGLILFPFTTDISDLIQDEKWQFMVLVILIVLATTLIDFGTGSLQSPAKAYLLDVLPMEHIGKGNVICSVWISLGSVVGFGIGAIKWSSNFNTQVKIGCGLSLVIIIIWLATTMCSFNERRSQQQRPESDNGTSQAQQINDQPNTENHQEQLNKKLQLATVENDEASNRITVTWQCAQMMKYMSVDDITILPYGEYVTDLVDDANNSGCFYENDFIRSLVENIRFVYYMSSHMWILWFSFFFGLLAIMSQTFFFTDYVAEFIYGGDVNADENSTEYQNYTKGVRIGSLAYGFSALSSVFVSLLLGPLLRLFAKENSYTTQNQEGRSSVLTNNK